MKNGTADSQTPTGGETAQVQCIAFEAQRCLGSGALPEVAAKVKAAMDNPDHGPILILDAVTSRPLEINLRGSVQEVLKRLARAVPSDGSEAASPRGPGRPKLGVVGREVTLLPRHWEWLDEQPGGASVAIRKLVEEARRSNREKDIARRSQDATYRFMSEMAGDLPGFEEALRAFYRGEKTRVAELIQPWPADIRKHLQKLIATAYADQAKAEQVQVGESSRKGRAQAPDTP